MNLEPVAITGVGVLSSVGIGYDAFAEAVTLGVVGLEPASFDETRLAGEVHDFNVVDYLVAEKTYLDRCSEFALAATKLCLDHAGLTELPYEPERRGLVIGTQYGCLDTMAKYTDRVKKRGTRFATPVMFSHAFVNTPASLVAIDFGLKGYHVPLVSGAASGTQALLTAMVGLQCGHAEAVIAGGVEALCPTLFEAVAGRMWAGDDPDEYDPLAGDGRVPGEGAAFLLLEPLAFAVARGATVHGLLSVGDQAELTVTTGPSDRAGSCPAGLYGDCFGASGALAAAAAVAGLAHGVIVPVRGGGDALETRREPAASRANAVRLQDGGEAAGGLTVTRA